MKNNENQWTCKKEMLIMQEARRPRDLSLGRLTSCSTMSLQQNLLEVQRKGNKVKLICRVGGGRSFYMYSGWTARAERPLFACALHVASCWCSSGSMQLIESSGEIKSNTLPAVQAWKRSCSMLNRGREVGNPCKGSGGWWDSCNKPFIFQVV